MKALQYWKYFIPMMLFSLNTQAGLLGLGGDSWKEEAMLHDGRTLIVERSQTYGGRREIGQASPVRTHSLRFSMPESGRTVSWTSEYGDELGRTNFNVLAIHIQDDTPYLVVEPNLCLAYNKWGRPNPPYVLFKYNGHAWQRLDMADLPKAFEKINLIVNNGRINDIKEVAREKGYVSASGVESFNSSLTQPQYKSILREAIEEPAGRCSEMISDGRGGWIGIGWFKKQPTRKACMDYCDGEKVSAANCPCKTLFKNEE